MVARSQATRNSPSTVSTNLGHVACSAVLWSDAVVLLVACFQSRIDNIFPVLQVLLSPLWEPEWRKTLAVLGYNTQHHGCSTMPALVVERDVINTKHDEPFLPYIPGLIYIPVLV